MSLLKIAIDATFTPHGGSIGHLIEFIKKFVTVYSKNNLILYTKKENLAIIGKDLVNKCTIKIVSSASYGNFSRLIWSQFLLPINCKINDFDILFCPGNFSPIIKTTKIKAQWIATIGPFSKDVYTSLSWLDKLSLFINKYAILFSGYTSNVVIHESFYSKKLFENKYYYNPKFQFLIECGKDDFYAPSKEKISSSRIISKLSNDDLLCVSHLYSYKNIELLISAFALYKRKNKTSTKIFIAGKIPDLNYFKNLEKLIKQQSLQNDIIFTGIIKKEELRYAYSNCKLFVFPSLCESSGYTLIEAMSCGAAVLCSNVTAMPFTCKYGAEYFNPYSKKDLKIKLHSILNNKKILTEMKKKALSRSSEMIDYKTATNQFLKIIDNRLENIY